MSLLSNIGSITVTASTALSAAAASLSAGQSGIGSSFSTVLPAMSMAADKFNWQSHWHYDPTEKKGIAIGRIQNDSSNTAAMGEYNEVTNTWTSDAAVTGFNATSRGHSWEMPCYNRTDHVLYYIQNGGQHDRVRKHTIGTAFTSWTDLATTTAGGAATSILYSGGPNFCSGSMSMEFHPNLYGSGQPGLVLLCEKGILGYNLTTNTYSTIISHTADNTDRTGAVYSSGLDAVFCYRVGIGQWKITSGPTITAINAPPVRFCQDTGGANGAKTCDDPNGGTFYAFEYNPSGTARAWKYVSASDSYSVIGDSPFGGTSEQEDFIVAAIYGYGVIAGLEETSGSQWRFRLYKPAS